MLTLNTNKKPFIVITAGDPAGIGPEIVKKALSSKAIKYKADYVVIEGKSQDIQTGKVQAKAGRIAFDNIKKAVALLQKHVGPKGLVTAPINKQAIKKAGIKYAGHTEMLAGLTKVKNVAMMFTYNKFSLVLVTRHIALKNVSKNITTKNIVDTTLLFSEALEMIVNKRVPSIIVAGLNPHASDGGVMGNEEYTKITPAVEILKKKKLDVTGPMAADIVFNLLRRRKTDGVVSMYHDQGLGPFKMLFFDKGINVTLGLPFIRTSPDHGTAFDIAGKNIADPTSMINAIKVAIKMAKQKKE
ncbi:MAG: 4-hydroxythreonine-4-phosphate dehydrogenase PdxA [Candidatus Omnitrophica bacterium]|nr:4-hydroxythreonine-4-phosphate dehydrogenase PdxA [Candidatus Omnitrophota bacterium]